MSRISASTAAGILLIGSSLLLLQSGTQFIPFGTMLAPAATYGSGNLYLGLQPTIGWTLAILAAAMLLSLGLHANNPGKLAGQLTRPTSRTFVTLLLGWPIADMPGCVESRSAQPGNPDAYDTDPKGNFVVCDGTMPSFPAMDYTPGTLTYGPAKPPPLDLDSEKRSDVSSPTQSPQPTTPGGVPDTPRLPKDPPCPPFGAEPLGSLNKLSTKVLAGYELRDGKCGRARDGQRQQSLRASRGSSHRLRDQRPRENTRLYTYVTFEDVMSVLNSGRSAARSLRWNP